MPYISNDAFQNAAGVGIRGFDKEGDRSTMAHVGAGGEQKLSSNSCFLAPAVRFVRQIHGDLLVMFQVGASEIRVKYLKYFAHKLMGTQTSIEIIVRLTTCLPWRLR